MELSKGVMAYGKKLKIKVARGKTTAVKRKRCKYFILSPLIRDWWLLTGITRQITRKQRSNNATTATTNESRSSTCFSTQGGPVPVPNLCRERNERKAEKNKAWSEQELSHSPVFWLWMKIGRMRIKTVAIRQPNLLLLNYFGLRVRTLMSKVSERNEIFAKLTFSSV